MKSRVLTALLAAVLTVGGVAIAAPAQADVACTITNFSPRTVVVGARPVTKTFSVSTTGCTKEFWSVQEENFDFYTSENFPQTTFNPYDNSEAGKKDVIVSAANADYSERQRVFAGGFSLLRATLWQAGSFNAGPEPVYRGGKVTVRGRLLVVDWSADRYVPYAGKQVNIQFRTPTGAYQTVGTAVTGSDGWVRASVLAPQTGFWRLSFGGTATTASATVAGDSVQMVG